MTEVTEEKWGKPYTVAQGEVVDHFRWVEHPSGHSWNYGLTHKFVDQAQPKGVSRKTILTRTSNLL